MDSLLITGAAGLVGQNLIARLKGRARRIVAVDKHGANLAILRRLHPEVEAIEADLAVPGAWIEKMKDSDSLVLAHAQIGGLHYAEFEANNITATRRILEAATQHGVKYIVQISSSVVNSMAVDFYTESKKAQERLFDTCSIPHVVLRPTLMFGWFDRKHLGWLHRFMHKVPLFPVPGNGKYHRQPLYVGDFCAIIGACLERHMTGTYDVSGQERIDYIDLIRKLRTVTAAPTTVVQIPYGLFWLLLRSYAVFDSNPPFTTKQLEALVTPDIFDVIDWPGIFEVKATSLDDALRETFLHPDYSKIALEF